MESKHILHSAIAILTISGYISIFLVSAACSTSGNTDQSSSNSTLTQSTTGTFSTQTQIEAKEMSREHRMMEFYAIVNHWYDLQAFNLANPNDALMYLAFYGRNAIQNPDMFKEQFLHYLTPIQASDEKQKEFNKKATEWFQSQLAEYKLHINEYINTGLTITKPDYQAEEGVSVHPAGSELSATDIQAIAQSTEVDDQTVQTLEKQLALKKKILGKLNGTWQLKGTMDKLSCTFVFKEDGYTFRAESDEYTYSEKGTIHRVNDVIHRVNDVIHRVNDVSKDTDYTCDASFSYVYQAKAATTAGHPAKSESSVATGEGTRSFVITFKKNYPMIIQDTYHTGFNVWMQSSPFLGVMTNTK